jgi:hypothetical protein
MNNTTNPLGGAAPTPQRRERRELARLGETEELSARHVGTRPVRHRGGRVLGGLGAQEAAVLRMQESTKSKMRV